jgi:hypothetical protein
LKPLLVIFKDKEDLKNQWNSILENWTEDGDNVMLRGDYLWRRKYDWPMKWKRRAQHTASLEPNPVSDDPEQVATEPVAPPETEIYLTYVSPKEAFEIIPIPNNLLNPMVTKTLTHTIIKSEYDKQSIKRRSLYEKFLTGTGILGPPSPSHKSTEEGTSGEIHRARMREATIARMREATTASHQLLAGYRRLGISENDLAESQREHLTEAESQREHAKPPIDLIKLGNYEYKSIVSQREFGNWTHLQHEKFVLIDRYSIYYSAVHIAKKLCLTTKEINYYLNYVKFNIPPNILMEYEKELIKLGLDALQIKEMISMPYAPFEPTEYPREHLPSLLEKILRDHMKYYLLFLIDEINSEEELYVPCKRVQKEKEKLDKEIQSWVGKTLKKLNYDKDEVVDDFLIKERKDAEDAQREYISVEKMKKDLDNSAFGVGHSRRANRIEIAFKKSRQNNFRFYWYELFYRSQTERMEAEKIDDKRIEAEKAVAAKKAEEEAAAAKKAEEEAVVEKAEQERLAAAKKAEEEAAAAKKAEEEAAAKKAEEEAVVEKAEQERLAAAKKAEEEAAAAKKAEEEAAAKKAEEEAGGDQPMSSEDELARAIAMSIAEADEEAAAAKKAEEEAVDSRHPITTDEVGPPPPIPTVGVGAGPPMPTGDAGPPPPIPTVGVGADIDNQNESRRRERSQMTLGERTAMGWPEDNEEDKRNWLENYGTVFGGGVKYKSKKRKKSKRKKSKRKKSKRKRENSKRKHKKSSKKKHNKYSKKLSIRK